jgi:hypothetical protein
VNKLSHRFVELIPDVLDEGVLYVSITYGTASHRCCCGCGREVVTPLTPTDWKLIFDGETITLYPSIGNWNFPCRSHYWISNNQVEWAKDWSEYKITASLVKDRNEKEKYYRRGDKGDHDEAPGTTEHGEDDFWSRLWKPH